MGVFEGQKFVTVVGRGWRFYSSEYVLWLEEQLKTTSKPLTFGELAVGDCFIGFPIDGDDSGHGGFRETHNLFWKTEELEDTGTSGIKSWVNSIGLQKLVLSKLDMAPNLQFGHRSHMPDLMRVIKVGL